MRELIYVSLAEIAMAEGIDVAEASLLDELRAMWGIVESPVE